MKLAVLKKLSVFSASLILIALGASVSHASSPQTVMTVTSDVMPGIASFVVNTDAQGDMTSVSYFEGGNPTPVSFSLNELVQGKVLVEKSGHKVVTLRTEAGFNAKDGGRFRVIYLANGITGSLRYALVELIRAGSSWTVYEVNGGRRNDTPFSKMHIIGSRFLGQLIGIKRIDTL